MTLLLLTDFNKVSNFPALSSSFSFFFFLQFNKVSKLSSTFFFFFLILLKNGNFDESRGVTIIENSLSTTPSNSYAYMQPPTMQESSDISKRHPFSFYPFGDL